jgi:hypothetical protein
MSLAKKLDPNVREAQRRHAAVCKALIGTKDKTGRAQALGTILRKFCKLSHLTGEQKDYAFKQVLNAAKARGIL